MKIGVYPGSFDPVTNGHMDIIERGSKLVDKLIIGVLENPDKRALLDKETRVELLQKLTAHLDNVEIYCFTGLLVDFVQQHDADIIIRGFRAISDFEYEMQMAQTNHLLDESIETIFLVTKTEYSYISSSIVKQVAKYNGDVSKMVSEEANELLKQNLGGK